MSKRTRWARWLTFFGFLLALNNSEALVLSSAEALASDGAGQNIFQKFDRHLKNEISLLPSFELDKAYGSWPQNKVNERYLALPEKVFYKTTTDYLNSLPAMQKIYEGINRFGKLETTLVFDTDVTLDPKLTPLRIPPEPPNPKIELGYGKKQKFAKIGVKLNMDKSFGAKPVTYLRLNLKTTSIQARFSPTDQKTVFELTSEKPLMNLKYGINYAVQKQQLDFSLYHMLSSNDIIRITSGFNFDSCEWKVQIVLFSPIKF